MRKLTKVIGLIYCLLIISCSTKTDVLEIFEKNIIESDVEIINLEGLGVLNPESVTMLDSNLLSYEQGLDSNFIKLFSAKNLEKIKSLGRVGNGPNEFSTNLSFPISSSEQQNISIYDWSKKMVHWYDYENGSFNRLQSHTLPAELMVTQRVSYLSDSLIVATGGIQNGVVALVSTNGNVRYLNPYEEITDEIDRRQRMEIFRNEITINYEKQMIAVAMRYFPEIIFYDFGGNIINRISLHEFDVSNILQTEESKRIIYYHDIGSSPGYLYAVYMGINIEELTESFEKEVKSISLSKIHKYSWEGDAKVSLSLDKNFHPFITVDYNNNRILSIDRFAAESMNLISFESVEIE